MRRPQAIWADLLRVRYLILTLSCDAESVGLWRVLDQRTDQLYRELRSQGLGPRALLADALRVAYRSWGGECRHDDGGCIAWYAADPIAELLESEGLTIRGWHTRHETRRQALAERRKARRALKGRELLEQMHAPLIEKEVS